MVTRSAVLHRAGSEDVPGAVHHLPDREGTARAGTRRAGTATRLPSSTCRTVPYTTCRMVHGGARPLRDAVRDRAGPEVCVRQVPVTTCRMVCEQKQCVVRQCRVNYVCEERVRMRPADDLQGHPRNALPHGPAHDLHDGAVHGELLREAVRAGVRADLPDRARDQAGVGSQESGDRSQESASRSREPGS